MEENYGDIHLHHSDYPGPCAPGACDTTYNYYHGNQCAGGIKNGHPYDCHCNLCQPPYSLPYQSGPGGHMGSLSGLAPCGNPYCHCTDCDGNCKCGAMEAVAAESVAVEKQPGFDLFDLLNLRNIVIVGLLIIAIVWFLRRRRRGPK
jgi:hypothetical protein